jgi:hypothetical protein
MKYLAHRGLWYKRHERNSPDALRNALSKGFGLETDVRDFGGEIVVSHDPVMAGAQLFSDLLFNYTTSGSDTPLAINVKADGLWDGLKVLLGQYNIRSYFCFDMSVPEMLQYDREGLRFFTRESEYEQHPAFYREASGVWMDMFHSDWILPDQIYFHLSANKEVAIVSPELHGRPNSAFWKRLRESKLHVHPAVMLCTDFPELAEQYFHEQD